MLGNGTVDGDEDGEWYVTVKVVLVEMWQWKSAMEGV